MRLPCLNVHCTVWIGQNDTSQNKDVVYQHLRADRMELVGGSLQGLDGVFWEDQIETSRALDKLAKVFYKFKEIDFVPFDKALAIARLQKKPIFGVCRAGSARQPELLTDRLRREGRSALPAGSDSEDQ